MGHNCVNFWIAKLKNLLAYSYKINGFERFLSRIIKSKYGRKIEFLG